MKRRTFLAAVVPIIAAVSPASGQSTLGTAATGDPSRPLSGRARPVGATAGVDTAPAAAAPAAAVAEPKKKKAPTEITSREAMLDNRIHLATFSGEVEVKDPEYNLTCDKLTVHLKKPKGKAEVKAPAPKPIGAADDEPPAKPKAPEKGDGESSGGIEKAIAEGNVKIVQEKVDADGKKQRYYGQARKAIFDPDKKTCVLYGWPRISQSADNEMGKEVIATQESTVITLNQAGVINVDGLNTVRLSDVNAFERNEKKPEDNR